MRRAQDMSESIKHAIVLLQIAKNATVPHEATTGVDKVFKTEQVSVSRDAN